MLNLPKKPLHPYLSYILTEQQTGFEFNTEAINQHAKDYVKENGNEAYVTSFYQSKAPINQFLVEQFTPLLKKYLPDFQLISAWYQRYKSFDSFNLHDHGSNAKVCGIFYLDDVGCTTFLNPNYLLPNQSTIINIASEKNKLVIFSSWIPHYVMPHRKKDERTIISFNLK